MALPHGAVGWSAACDCGISLSYSPTFNPMKYVHIDTSMGLSIVNFKGFSKFCCFFLFLKIVLILTNSTDPDEMPHYAAFYLGLNCFAKVPV